MKGYSQKTNFYLESEADPAFARRAKIILNNLKIKPNDRVLDVGCGRGFYLRSVKEIEPMADIYGVDLNDKYLAKAKKTVNGLNIKIIKGDILNLPFKNNFFNKVIASEILEHVDNDERAILEIHRVLKPGGSVLITVPNKDYPFFWDPLNWTLEKFLDIHIPSNIWWLAGIWADHIRLYSEGELTIKLRKAGFKIKKLVKTTYYCFPFSHFILYGIGKNIVELGLMKNFDRFSTRTGKSLINKLILWPFRLIDSLNEGKNFKTSSVNIIVKAVK